MIMDSGRVYEVIRRAVIWGEPEEEVRERFTAYGVEGDEADAMYFEARRERISIIRRGYAGKLVQGILFLGAGVGVFSTYRPGYGVLTGDTFVVSFVLGAIGLWWLIDCLMGIILAPTKRGSVSIE